MTEPANPAALLPSPAGEPVRLIFDTDMGNDVDDALALGMIHTLQTRGYCRLSAVTLTKDNDLAAPFVDAVNTFYGRPQLPIGVVEDGPTPATGRFLGLATVTDDGAPRYPHDLQSGADAPEAVSLLRRVLAEQPDHSVVIAQVGFSTNLARLLASGPDEASPMPGRELAAKKVRLVSAMAGSFAPVEGHDRYCEYNVATDVPSAKRLVRDWPGEIVFSGWEVGAAIPYPAASIDNDFDYVKHHPLSEAYQLYNPTPHERPTWDLTSVLHGVLPEAGLFDVSDPGRVDVADDGYTEFKPDSHGGHRYLSVSDDQARRLQAIMVDLCSQPPATAG